MAARLNKKHTDSVLARIQTSQLVNRLQGHALGTLKGPPCADHPKGKEIWLTDGQIRAACFLIERTLAKAEAPKKLELSGEITLIEALRKAASGN